MQEHYEKQDYFRVWCEVNNIQIPEEGTDTFWIHQDIYYRNFKEDIEDYEVHYQDIMGYDTYLKEIIPMVQG
tara:strand:+ start:86 stop:301 length:216 start_codon:yes stop_codon:yes gene_type:complete